MSKSQAPAKQKKKWSKGKVKDKAQHSVLLDKSTSEKLYKDVQSYRLVTIATLVDRMKINGSLARQCIADLEEKGMIKPVVTHSKMKIYSTPLPYGRDDRADPTRSRKRRDANIFAPLQPVPSVLPKSNRYKVFSIWNFGVCYGLSDRTARGWRIWCKADITWFGRFYTRYSIPREPKLPTNGNGMKQKMIFTTTSLAICSECVWGESGTLISKRAGC